MPFDPLPALVSTAPPTPPTAIYLDAEYRQDVAEPILVCAMIGADRYTLFGVI